MKNLQTLKEQLIKKYAHIIDTDKAANLSILEIIDAICSYYEDIIYCTPGNVYWLSNQGMTIGGNKNVLDSFGLKSMREFSGLSFEEMGEIGHWNVETTRSFKKDTFDVIKTKQPKLNVQEPPIPMPDGRTAHFLTSRVPVLNKQGEVIAVVGISIDIADRIELEQKLKDALFAAESANRAKSAFVANISHDIRLPLTGVIGISDIMVMDEKQRTAENALLIKNSGDKLLLMLNKILDFVKAESPDFQSFEKKELFSLRSLIHDTVDLYSAVIKKKNLTLHAEIDPKLPEVLSSTPQHIYKILNNLVGNAIKFTEKGGITITVNFDITSSSPHIELAVKDTGVGVPADKREAIFGWFERLTPAYQGIYQGTGLGLAMVKQSIESLHGKIQVTDNQPHGTVFSCTIPVEITESLEGYEHKSFLDHAAVHEAEMLIKSFSQTATQEKPVSISDTPSSDKGQLLLIEDSVPAAHAAKLLFEREGYNVKWVANGTDAISTAINHNYDLIICDIGLPDIDGIKVTIKCREKNVACPIFALTAHADLNKEELIAAGFTDLLVKPLSISEFKKKLAAVTNEQVMLEYEKKLVNLNMAIYAFGIPESFVNTFLPIIYDNLPLEIQELKQAAKQKNVEKVEGILHKIRGGVLYCGPSRLLNAIADTEGKIRKKDYSDLDELLVPLYVVAEDTLTEIKRIIESKGQ